jgi:hypothetical protein
MIQVASARRAAAFSLIEILTVVALLSFIIIGLMAMFTQTQRAWKTSMTQKDMLESGRMATELLTRDFLSMMPSLQPGVINFSVADNPLYAQNLLKPLAQGFPTPTEMRVNLLQEVFFLTHENKSWRAIGLRVDSPDLDMIQGGVGTLYRFEVGTVGLDANATNGNFLRFLGSVITNGAVPLIDGVVHFAVRAYDTNGIAITPLWYQQVGLTNAAIFNNVKALNSRIPDAWQSRFLSNAVPAYVDVEIGILEARIAEHARAIPNYAVRTNYLQKQLGSVHLFRQRIPIRSVDPKAYK